MIIYKYIENLFEDDPNAEKFCKQHKMVYFKPTPELKSWLENWLKTTKLPVMKTATDIICYWRYFGTWGMYHPEDNSISICPYSIDEAPGGLEGVISHEVEHLKHPEANNLSHDKKEAYINKRTLKF